jgi:putative two-component system response regulator
MDERKTCIFLVDDNIVNLNTGKTALQHKYTVITIPSGEKLLLSLKKVKPDLILLDIDMPGMSGYDTLKALKLNPETSDIPVIFLTGKNESEDELLGLSLGAVDYITKPFSQSILLKRVELHLLLQAQKKELREFNANLLDMVNERVNDISALQNAIITWAAEVIEFRDEETGRHVERVQKYLQILLTKMEKTGRYADEVAMWDIGAFLKSALLHDVGKIKIRDEILLKKTRLTDEEIVSMKLHSLYGKTLLESLQDKVPNQMFLEYAKVLAHRHHERWDGTGYPDRLKGEEIPLQARMMSLADVYDALISERPYKKAFSHEEAMRNIAEGRGTQFDPDLTDLFVSLSDKIREISEDTENA